MDLDILEEEAHDLLSIVDREVRRRRFGACVRLEVDAGIPDRIRRLLLEKLEIDDEDVYESTGPLGLSALMSHRVACPGPTCAIRRSRRACRAELADDGRPVRGHPQAATSCCTTPTTRSPRCWTSCAAPPTTRRCWRSR